MALWWACVLWIIWRIMRDRMADIFRNWKISNVNTNLLCRGFTISLISHHFSPFSLCLQTFLYKNGSVDLGTFHGFAGILLTDECVQCFGLAQCQSNSDFQHQAAAPACFEWQTNVCVGMWKQVVWDVWNQQSIWALECDCTTLCTPNPDWDQQSLNKLASFPNPSFCNLSWEPKYIPVFVSGLKILQPVYNYFT